MLVSGLGMGMQFLQTLVNEIVKQGGHPEMLYGMCLPNDTARELVAKIASVIVKSEWRIPRSLLERLAPEDNEEMFGSGKPNHRWGWRPTVEKLGIPMLYFSNDSGTDSPFIPTEIVRQIVGKPFVCPLFVKYDGEEYLVIDGSVFDSEVGVVYTEIQYDDLHIAPARYFDMNH